MKSGSRAVLCVFLGCGLGACSPDPQTLVDFPEGATHDWGQVDANTILTAHLPVRNRSGVPIRVVGTKTSCGCTAIRVVPEKLAPGETARIDVELDTGSGGRTSVDGAVEFASEAVVETVPIGVRFQVRRSAHFEPTSLAISKLPDGKVLPAAIRLEMRGVDESVARETAAHAKASESWLALEVARFERVDQDAWIAWLTARIRCGDSW